MSDIFSLSGEIVPGYIEETLYKVVKDQSGLANLIGAAFDAGKISFEPAKNVIDDYREASLQLPKYYKEDTERVASISIISAPNDKNLPGSGSKYVTMGKPLDTFILRGVRESFKERYQIIETFGDDYGVFFTGQSPNFFTFTGIFINDAYRMWKSVVVASYAALLRGTQSARKGAKVVITYDYIRVEGYILDLTCDIQSENEVEVPFTFTMLVTGYEDYGPELYERPQLQAFEGAEDNQESPSLFSANLAELANETVPGIDRSPYYHPMTAAINRISANTSSEAMKIGLSELKDSFASLSGTLAWVSGGIVPPVSELANIFSGAVAGVQAADPVAVITTLTV